MLTTQNDVRQPAIIFVVDDEAMVRKVLARVLRNPRYVVHGFENPVEALAKLEELRPRLVISDNEMPKMKGLDFLRKVRSEWPGICTLMLTGSHLGDQVRAAVAGGEIDHLVEKPWLDDQLRDTVRELLGSR